MHGIHDETLLISISTLRLYLPREGVVKYQYVDTTVSRFHLPSDSFLMRVAAGHRNKYLELKNQNRTWFQSSTFTLGLEEIFRLIPSWWQQEGLLVCMYFSWFVLSILASECQVIFKLSPCDNLLLTFTCGVDL